MAVDLSRVAGKAIEAALEDGQQQRRRGSAVRAFAAGAVLAVGARAAISRTPGPARFGLTHLPGMSELRAMPERLRERLADAGWLDDDTDVEEPEGAYEDEGSEAEGDEDFDDDDEDEDFGDDEEEPAAEADEDFEEGEEEPDDEEEPPELEVESEDDEDLHPEDRPPEPPRSKTGGRR